MKKRSSNLSVFVFYALIILTILFVLSNSLTSGFLARYLSTDSSGDNARVAKWEILFNGDDEFNVNIPSYHLENGSKGEWGLDISNKSETLAKIASESSIKLKLYSTSFHADHHHDSWDFLEDANHQVIDNPINFKIYIYNCSLEELKDTYFENGVFKPELLEPGISIEERLLLDTNSTNLKFEMNIDSGIICHEASIDIGNLGETFNLAIGNGNACIKVLWSVESTDDSYSYKESFKSYHLIKMDEYNKNIYGGIVQYQGTDLIDLSSTSLTDAQINSYLDTNSYNISGTKYIIAYKLYDAFEYLIYSSSLGGEVMITLTDADVTYLKKCTQLSQEEKSILEARTNVNVTSVDMLEKYIEKIECKSYLEFLEEKKAFEAAIGYLGLELECMISLNLRVEQIN